MTRCTTTSFAISCGGSVGSRTQTTLLGPGSTPTAAAAVVQAAQKAADLDAGEITGSLTLTNLDGEAGSADTFDYRYSGADYTVDYNSGQESVRIIGLGDTVYTKEAADSPFYIPTDRDNENAGVIDTVFDLSVEAAGTSGVVAADPRAD